MKYTIYNVTQDAFLSNPYSATRKDKKGGVTLVSAGWRKDLNEMCLMEIDQARTTINLMISRYKKINKPNELKIIEVDIDQDGDFALGDTL